MLKAYKFMPFDQSSEMDKTDYFVGDGVTRTFNLLNKSGLRVGDTVQVGTTLLERALGAFSVSGDQVILSITPAPGDIVTVPGVNSFNFKAFDQSEVTGDDSPRTKQVSFYIVDIDDINWLYHHAAPGQDGIRISFTDHDESFGANSDWFQLAKAIGSGEADTFNAVGAPLFLPDFSYQDALQSSISALATTIDVTDGSSFHVGDVLAIDWGISIMDVVTVEEISGNTLTISSNNESHDAGAVVYVIGMKCWGQGTIPDNAAGNQPIAYFEMSLDILAVSESRAGITVSSPGSGDACCPATINNITTTGHQLIVGLNKITLSSADITAMLPSAASHTGETVIVKRMDNTVHSLTINTSSSQTIDDELTLDMPEQYNSYSLMSDGANWNNI